jgi:hypothetical protein
VSQPRVRSNLLFAEVRVVCSASSLQRSSPSIHHCLLSNFLSHTVRRADGAVRDIFVR